MARVKWILQVFLHNIIIYWAEKGTLLKPRTYDISQKIFLPYLIWCYDSQLEHSTFLRGKRAPQNAVFMVAHLSKCVQKLKFLQFRNAFSNIDCFLAIREKLLFFFWKSLLFEKNRFLKIRPLRENPFFENPSSSRKSVFWKSVLFEKIRFLKIRPLRENQFFENPSSSRKTVFWKSVLFEKIRFLKILPLRENPFFENPSSSRKSVFWKSILFEKIRFLKIRPLRENPVYENPSSPSISGAINDLTWSEYFWLLPRSCCKKSIIGIT